MLPAKPWKTEAIMRLLLGVFVCVFAGSLLVTALHPVPGHRPHAWWIYPIIIGALICLGATLVQLRHTWELEGLLQRLLLSLGWFYAAVLLGMWAQKLAGAAGQSMSQVVVGTLSFQGGTLLLAGFFVREHQTNWTGAFGFNQNWLHALLFGVILGCLFLPLGRALQHLSAEVMLRLPRLHLEPREQEVVQTLQLASKPWQWLVLGLVTIGLAPTGEEVLFRGILYPWVKRAGFPRLALWLTSVLFGAIHLNLLTFLPLTALALLLTLVYEYTGNLLAPIVAHAVFNGINFSLVYLLRAPPG